MKTYSITDIGRRRTMNQDYVYASEQPVGNLKNLLIVADGMGGHNAGDLASRYTVELMVEYITNEKDEKRPVSLLSSAIHHANELVMEKARSAKEYEGMGTTLVAATVTDGCLYVANVGDSRLYLIDQGKIRLHEDTDVLLDQYGILKVTESEFAALDKQYILAYCKEDFGYRCLTDQKQYYMENMPQIVIEKGTIDEVMKTMLKGSSRKGVSL